MKIPKIDEVIKAKNGKSSRKLESCIKQLDDLLCSKTKDETKPQQDCLDIQQNKSDS